MKMVAELQQKFDDAVSMFAEDPAKGLKMLKAETHYQFIEATRGFLPEQFRLNKALNEQVEQLKAKDDKNADQAYLVAVAHEYNRDPEQALKSYREAASKGHGDALNYMGKVHQWGLNVYNAFDSVAIVDVDIEKAESYYKQAAEKGHAEAQCHLGMLVASRKPVRPLKWTMESANQDYAAAQYNLGVFYRDGANGVKKDSKQSLAWFRKSADQGYPKAREEAAKIDFPHVLAIFESKLMADDGMKELYGEENLKSYSAIAKQALKEVLKQSWRARVSDEAILSEIHTTTQYDQPLVDAVKEALESPQSDKPIKEAIASCVLEQAQGKFYYQGLNGLALQYMPEKIKAVSSGLPHDFDPQAEVPLLAKYKRNLLREPRPSESTPEASHASAVKLMRNLNAQLADRASRA